MGRVAIVTGGSRGIGAACAVALAADGWRVCVTYRERRDAAAEVVARCGHGALAVRADAAVEAEVVAAFEAAAELGAIGALVNNAGIVAPGSRVEEMTAARVERILAVNVVGVFVAAREAVRRMSTRNGGSGGSIVNVSSAAARLGGPGQYVDYAASKGAVDTFTLGLAREVAAEGIRVNSVRPGIIDTDIHASGGDPDRARRLAGVVPMQRPGGADEVAGAVRWLCSDEASYTTGAIVDVTGGR